jgi:hypothetical protein
VADDPNRPVILTTVPTEQEAALLAAALEGRGIKTQRTGDLTSGLRAEAPGEVRILVRQRDLAEAQAALRAIESQKKKRKRP